MKNRVLYGALKREAHRAILRMTLVDKLRSMAPLFRWSVGSTAATTLPIISTQYVHR